jgi:hypothetical protein
MEEETGKIVIRRRAGIVLPGIACILFGSVTLFRLISDMLTNGKFLPWWGYLIGLLFLLVGLALVGSFPLKVVLDRRAGTCVVSQGLLMPLWRKRLPLSKISGVDVTSEKRVTRGVVDYVHCLRLNVKDGRPILLRESDSPQKVLTLGEQIRDYLNVPLSKSLVVSGESGQN